MATSRKEVELVIRARDEATKAVHSVSDALKFLATAQHDVASGAGEVGAGMGALKSAITAVQGAYAKIDKDADAASAAFDRQRAALVSTKDEYAAVVAQIDAAKEALTRLRGQKAPDFVGPVNVPLLKATESAYRDLQSQSAKLTRDMARQEQVLDGARSALQQLGSTAIAAEQALDGVGSADQRAAIIGQAEAFERATRQAEGYRREIVRLASDEAARKNDQFFGISARPSNSARDSAAVFEEAARAEVHMAAGAAELKARLDPLAAIQTKLNADLAKARDLYRAGRITATELASAERLLATEAEHAGRAMGQSTGGKGGFLGLKPYELTSLSYQINDVFTQLASGTSLTQTLAQQGGQTFQIFQRQIGAILPMVIRFLPLIGGAVTALLSVRAAMKQISDENESRRGFAGVLAASADGAEHQAGALAKAAHELDVYGGSLKEAREGVQAFLQAGVKDEQLERFGRSAIDMARVFKIQIPDAMKQTAAAFTGGFDAIKRLDDGLDFLTTAEREHIKTMFDSGNAAGARTEAFRIFESRMESAAEKSRGPWAKAFRDLGAAWDGFLGFLGRTPVIQGALHLMEGLASAAERFAAALPGATSNAAAGTSPEVVRLEEHLTKLRQDRAAAAVREAESDERLHKPALLTGNQPNRLRGNAADRAVIGGRGTASLDVEINAAEARLAKLKKALADTINPAAQGELKATAEALAQLERDRATSIGDQTDVQKVRMAGERAYQDEIRNTGNVAVAEARKRLAIDLEIDRQRKAINYADLANVIIRDESGGNPNAKNPASTATGTGQFIESTWLRLFKEHFPTQAADISRQQILDLRQDTEKSRQLVEIYARENAKVLQAAGLAVTRAGLYLAHVFGPQGAVKLLSADASTPVSKLLSGEAVTANPRILKGKTAGQVIGYARQRVGRSDEERAAMSAQAAIVEKLNKDAKDFNDTLTQRIQGWRDEADALADLTRVEQLSIEERYAANKARAIAAEINRAENEALEKNQVLSDAHRKAITDSVAALYERTHATAVHNQVLTRNNEIVQEAIDRAKELAKEQRDFIADTIGLEQQRQALLNQLSGALSEGDQAEVVNLRDQIEALRLKIVETIPHALELARALGDEKAVASLQRVAFTVQTVREQIISAGQVNEMLASGFVNAFDRMATAIGEGKNAISSMADAFRSFASDFLRQIAMMILKTTIFRLLSSALGGSSGGIGGIIAGAVNSMAGAAVAAPTKHGGGLAGSGPTTLRPASLWAQMTRYHGGGVVGLRPDEIPAILQKNEEVLTASDPRHRFNGGAASAAPAVNMKIVNTIDPGEVLSAAAATDVGQRAILNVLRMNAGGARAAIGVPG